MQFIVSIFIFFLLLIAGFDMVVLIPSNRSGKKLGWCRIDGRSTRQTTHMPKVKQNALLTAEQYSRRNVSIIHMAAPF